MGYRSYHFKEWLQGMAADSSPTHDFMLFVPWMFETSRVIRTLVTIPLVNVVSTHFSAKIHILEGRSWGIRMVI